MLTESSHDFNIVSSGSGAFDTSTAVLKWSNPPRRDVAMLPGSGYLFIAFKVRFHTGVTQI